MNTKPLKQEDLETEKPNSDARAESMLRTMLAMRRPLKGYAWNPLRKLPRNKPCPCRSGLKFKRCCLANLQPIIPESAAEAYKEQMAKPDLVFVTKTNGHLLTEEARAKLDEQAVVH